MEVINASKKERKERIKFFLLVIGFILVSFSIQHSKAETVQPNEIKTIRLSDSVQLNKVKAIGTSTLVQHNKAEKMRASAAALPKKVKATRTSASVKSNKLKAAKSSVVEFSQVLRIITLSSPKGQTERFTSDSDQLQSQFSTRTFDGHGVKLSTNNSECLDTTKGLHAATKMTENELELSSVIKSLNDQLTPRRLLQSQVDTLKGIPMCQPYLADLKIIARLLDGWELEKIEYL